MPLIEKPTPMKLKQEVIERIYGRKDVGHQIAVSMGVTKTTVNNWLRENRDNNPLTSFTVMQILQTELNLTPDQILDGEFINQQNPQDGTTTHDRRGS